MTKLTNQGTIDKNTYQMTYVKRRSKTMVLFFVYNDAALEIGKGAKCEKRVNEKIIIIIFIAEHPCRTPINSNQFSYIVHCTEE